MVGVAALAPCQCARATAEHPCRQTATAEDLLCDWCRPGCVSFEIDGGGVFAHCRLSGSGSSAINVWEV
jgi:uridine phosphorylase